MQDSSGVSDSLPLTTLALNNALLRWGLFDSATRKIGYYLDTFVLANGTIDMGHWKDPWPDAGQGRYNCTYPDGLTDHGRVLQLFTDAVRYTRDLDFMRAHLRPALRIAQYLLHSRREAVAAHPPSDPRHGLVYGPAEHDTCEMGMTGIDGTPAAPVVGGQHMNYYFSVSMWHWRGMVEMGQLLLDYPAAASAAGANATFAHELLQEAAALADDVRGALNASVVPLSEAHVAGGDSAGIFVPCAVAAANSTVTPYPTMTSGTVASYSNFRYYSEMLSSGFMDPTMAAALMDFRETHGGTLSGMTRYTDHLDDMPAIGYAVSSLAADRIPQFLLLLYGHMANYQGRGSFFTTEQQSLYQGSARWRATLGEVQDDFCTPSQTLVSTMSAMQLVDSERLRSYAYADMDAAAAPVVWLARAAPRRWYAEPEGFGATNAPTRWGNVSFTVRGRGGSAVFDVVLSADFSQPAASASRTPQIKMRVRDLQPKSRTLRVIQPPAASESGCVVTVLDSDAELLLVTPNKNAISMSHCSFVVGYT